MSDEKEKNYIKDPKMLMSFGAGALTSGLGLHFFKKSDNQQIEQLQKEKNELTQKNKNLQNENTTLQSEKSNLQNENYNLKGQPNLANLRQNNQLKSENIELQRLQREVDQLKQKNEVLELKNQFIPTADTTNQQQQEQFKSVLTDILKQLETVESSF